ncbi:MAG: helix-turn-helix transcriptional regulator [Bdellovibrio sp.]|nr:helix-turn-helix transcriptional regulator [Bdellovibrio sp.]
MVESYSLDWNKETLRDLRLRLGWSRSELARKLHCAPEEIESWEDGTGLIALAMKGELEIILRQAEACSEEVQFTPAAENECAKNALEQINFSRVKADLE